MRDTTTHRGITTRLPLEHIGALKRSALELAETRTRFVGSADLIRFAVAELVARLRNEPSRVLANVCAWLELEAGAEAEAPELPSLGKAMIPDAPSTAHTNQDRVRRPNLPTPAKRATAKKGRKR